MGASTLLRISSLCAAFTLALSLACVPALAADAPKPERAVDMAAVLKPGPLPELVEGDANGVPVVEYGSLTCSHCGVFAREVLPKFEKAYVETGKVRFIFREFARNPLDLGAFVLARCLGDDKALAAVELLFAQQDKWAFVDKPLEPLIAAMRPAGLAHDKAMECLKDQQKAEAIRSIGMTASDVTQIEGTPSFAIDGKFYGGELTLDQLDAILKPLVK